MGLSPYNAIWKGNVSIATTGICEPRRSGPTHDVPFRDETRCLLGDWIHCPNDAVVSIFNTVEGGIRWIVLLERSFGLTRILILSGVDGLNV